MSVAAKARDLSEFCDINSLKEEFNYLKERCSTYASRIKSDKFAIERVENMLKADKYETASNGLTVNPKKILRGVSAMYYRRAQKDVLKMRKLDLKDNKKSYQDFVRKRKEIVKRIKETYEEKKEEIQRGKEEKAREMGEKIRNMPSRAKNAVRDTVNDKAQVVGKFVQGLTGRQEDDERDDR